ncbi:hypothetical protein Mgra_00008190 [Meloidogyne graminicola]|uniref:Protein Abitram n=1 Tax=Meloidogyne graminicola TaxID=189291 RepID=A0A8S9ZGG5_9BILA|nr:hypothetical protein Mgra_00008190 [Meloidogyne graminicola]
MNPPIYPSYIERTFNSFTLVNNPGIRYLKHPTGVIILTLSSDHELIKNKETLKIVSINWNIPGKKKNGEKDRSKLEVNGKGKKGGLQLMPDTRICIIKDDNGCEYTIRAGLKAILLEVNSERLNNNPNLIVDAVDNHGFVAILIVPNSS